MEWKCQLELITGEGKHRYATLEQEGRKRGLRDLIAAGKKEASHPCVVKRIPPKKNRHVDFLIAPSRLAFIVCWSPRVFIFVFLFFGSDPKKQEKPP